MSIQDYQIIRCISIENALISQFLAKVETNPDFSRVTVRSSVVHMHHSDINFETLK